VKTGDNHHVEILETKDAKGPHRLGRGRCLPVGGGPAQEVRLPVVRRDHGPDRKFVFSLSPTESVRMKDESGSLAVLKVTGVSENEKGTVSLELHRNADARLSAVLRKTKGGRVFKTPEYLEGIHGLRRGKILISPLGRCAAAHD